MRDTIYALASARGRAGVSVVRVSGPRAWAACAVLCGDVPPPRRASLRNILWQDEAVGPSDRGGLCQRGQLYRRRFGRIPPARQFGRAVRCSAALSAQDGLRPAEAGEFTRRALENGKLDLAQVEGLADLIDAETEAQRRHAMTLMQGACASVAETWRQSLIRAAALLEATIDFADEDVPVDVTPEVLESSDRGSAVRAVRRSPRLWRRRNGLRDGFEVALVGRVRMRENPHFSTLGRARGCNHLDHRGHNARRDRSSAGSGVCPSPCWTRRACATPRTRSSGSESTGPSTAPPAPICGCSCWMKRGMCRLSPTAR
jgi:tRNA modification GTPase